MKPTKLELTDSERVLLLQLLSRACAHVGAEVAQSGVNNASPAAELLAFASSLSAKL